VGGKRCSVSDFVVWVVSVVLGPTFTNDRAGAKKFQRKGVSLRFWKRSLNGLKSPRFGLTRC